MRLQKGSNQHKDKYQYPLGLRAIDWIRILIVLVLMLGGSWVASTHQPAVLSPLQDPIYTFSETVTPTPKLTVDQLVDKYSIKYGKTRYEQNRTKALLHFLLLREQNYGGSNNCGDSGLACGPLQFHEATYEGYRTIMIKRGLVKTMGSRLDMDNAIETCAWAISDGRETAWGPIARNEIQL